LNRNGKSEVALFKHDSCAGMRQRLEPSLPGRFLKLIRLPATAALEPMEAQATVVA
jgi:hypothetical protein